MPLEGGPRRGRYHPVNLTYAEVYDRGGAATVIIICSWHLDRSWRIGMQQYITDKSKQAEVYHHLRILLEEGSEGAFRHRLQQFISWLSEYEHLLGFLEYFRRGYVPRITQWAPCYRRGTPVNVFLYTTYTR
jgi:predicted metallo-beta-lactamase superfamily hydrolase